MAPGEMEIMSDTPPTPEPPEPELPPYVIEGARSSRSRCKTCRRGIDKDTLRLGILIEGPYGTGYMWHHLKCAAKRRFEQVAEAYEQEAWNNAKKPPEDVPPLDKLQKLHDDTDKQRKERKQIPYAEPAPSGRARCKHCSELIEKGSMRVVLGRAVEFGNQVRTTPINVHPRCVAEVLQEEDCATEAEGFAGNLHSNSGDVGSERIAAVLAEVGDLG
jgi:hypothetical protein